MIAVGVGCRRGVAAAAVLSLVREALARLDGGAAPSGLFTVAEKRGEAGLHAAAHALGLPLIVLDRTALAAAVDGARSRSRRVDAIFGLPGIAETAALAGAGPGAVLLVTRMASPTVTCAIAGAAPPRDALPPSAPGG